MIAVDSKHFSSLYDSLVYVDSKTININFDNKRMYWNTGISKSINSYELKDLLIVCESAILCKTVHIMIHDTYLVFNMNLSKIGKIRFIVNQVQQIE